MDRSAIFDIFEENLNGCTVTVEQDLGSFVIVNIFPDELEGCIAVRKLKKIGRPIISPATIDFEFDRRNHTPDHVDTIARWIQQAANVARLLDLHCPTLNGRIEIRQVDGFLVVEVLEQEEVA